MKETNIVRTIMLALGKIPSLKLFRNNVGTGWVGKTGNVKGGGIIIRDPRRLDAGLIEGSSDLIGWKEEIILPSMVGKKVAIFTAIEVKRDRGTLSPSQLNFINQVQRAGGIAGLVRSEEQAKDFINTYKI